MRKLCAIIMLAALWSGSALAANGNGGVSTTAAVGLIRFEPPQSLGCVAVRVEVPENKMITGLRWRNGTSTLAFPKILVASGSDFFPPPYSEAVTVAEEVQGQEQSWSSVIFAAPVASQSGTLFIIMEYPANYAPSASGPVLGVGYAEEDARFVHFVTGDGENWIRIASRCRVLVEPILADSTPGILELGAQLDLEPAVPPALPGLSVAPNPFNPQTRIDLYLAAASAGQVKILDVRGSLIAELHHGQLPQGHTSFIWKGTDRSGKRVASGVYWVLAQVSDQKFVQKLLLIK